MTEVTQVPGELDIKITQGDDMSILLDFDISLSGYTFESKVIEADDTETVITVVATDLGEGQVTLTMTDTLSGALNLTGGNTKDRWYLDRTNAGNQRRLLAGNFQVILFK